MQAAAANRHRASGGACESPGSTLSDTTTSSPDAIEDVAAMNGLVASLDQEDQEVEMMRGMRRSSCPPRVSARRRGERMKSANR